MIESKKPADGVVKIINAEHIIDPPNPNRQEISQEELQWLADSIARDGLINPITVRPVGDKFEVVAGHRRFRACLLANKINIECFVKTLTDEEAESIKANENLYRQDLDPIEEAMALSRLIGTDENKIPQIAKQWGKTEDWVLNRLNILEYPTYFIPAIKNNHIKLGVAKALSQIEEEHYRKMFFDNALRDGMTLWTAEYYLAQWKQGIFKKGEEIMPPETGAAPTTIATIRQPCAKCGRTAEAPNLTNVFVHVTCPEDNVKPS